MQAEIRLRRKMTSKFRKWHLCDVNFMPNGRQSENFPLWYNWNQDKGGNFWWICSKNTISHKCLQNVQAQKLYDNAMNIHQIFWDFEMIWVYLSKLKYISVYLRSAITRQFSKIQYDIIDLPERKIGITRKRMILMLMLS